MAGEQPDTLEEFVYRSGGSDVLLLQLAGGDILAAYIATGRLHFADLSSPPPTPPAGRVCLYFEGGALKSKNDAGTVTTY